MTCSLTSKDITIVGGSIPPSGISPLNRRSAKLLDPVSIKSGEGHDSFQQNQWSRYGSSNLGRGKTVLSLVRFQHWLVRSCL
jgi:hypothetical protein